jgi:hypothetical protein
MNIEKEMKEIELGMSNFDHEIDSGFAEALMAAPGAVFGRHAAWNFNGLVYFKHGKFHEQVWIYLEYRETLSADSLKELMKIVCDKYGYR